MIWAQRSPFCHKFFQSRKYMRVADIHVMYSILVNVTETDSKLILELYLLDLLKTAVSKPQEEGGLPATQNLGEFA